MVADVIDVVRALTTDPQNRVPHLAFQADLLSDHPILPIAECQSAYYLRIQVQDRPGVLAKVATSSPSVASTSSRSCRRKLRNRTVWCR